MGFVGSLIQILILSSILLFHLSFSGVTIISYSELELDFVEYMNEYKRYFKNRRDLPNPFTIEVREELRQICHDIPYARTFELFGKEQTEIKKAVKSYAECEDITDLQTVGYEKITTRVHNFQDDIPMFPCYKDPTHGYIYVTSGFSLNFKFLFRQRDLHMNPILYAVVESRPLIAKSFIDQRHLEKYFVHVHRMYELKSENRLSLSRLNSNQHLRLCCLVEDARRVHRGQRNREERNQETSLGIDNLGLEQTVDINFEKLDKLNPVYATMEILIATLPCYSDDEQVMFYMSKNPKGRNSVFVLEQRINPDSKKLEVFVAQYVDNIVMLKNIDELYAIRRTG